MLNKECDKNFNNYTYGGYECGIDGKWSNICKPFYCHKDYYFDYVNQKCVKDVIAEKYTYINNNSNNNSNETIFDITDSESEEDEPKNNKTMVIVIIIVAIVVFIILIIYCCKK